MASITVRNLDDDLKRRLRIRAAQHGRSMEQEARDMARGILKEALDTERPVEEDLAGPSALASRLSVVLIWNYPRVSPCPTRLNSAELPL